LDSGDRVEFVEIGKREFPIAIRGGGERHGFVVLRVARLLSVMVIAELVWVLQFSSRFNKHEIEHVVEKLWRSRELVVERAEIVAQAWRKFRICRANFADCLIERCGHAAECQYVLTLDKDAAAEGMRRLAMRTSAVGKGEFSELPMYPEELLHYAHFSRLPVIWQALHKHAPVLFFQDAIVKQHQ
jgi:predicted nucleic-acid-binding protein